MDFQTIISHMNNEHKENLKDLCKKFGGVQEVQNVLLKSVDFEGLDLIFEGINLRIEFPKKADENSIKDAIIELCKSAKDEKSEDLAKEIGDFMLSFNSVCLATLSPNGEAVCSYAPFVSTQWGNFIYISEASEHFANIKANPHNLELMFLEDESKATSVILRKRLRYRTRASFLKRSELFDKIYDEFERQTGGAGGIKTIRNMLDFHLVKLEFLTGRFVKGFGQAYDIKDDKITNAGMKNPHKFPHK